jgi:hypothetical protein
MQKRHLVHAMKSPREHLAVAVRLAAALLAVAPAFAQSDSADALAAKATDPTAQLMSFQLNDWYVINHHGLDEGSNQIVLRAAIPFDLGPTKHIFRVTQAYATSGPRGTGLVDTGLFDLMVFDASWGRWGIGLAGTIPNGSTGLSTEKWTLGPALGFVDSSHKPWMWGLFLQSFFSIAGDSKAPDVGLLNLQPILSWQLGQGRSLSLGNSAIVYDLENSRWSSLLIGVNYGQVTSLWGQKWRPNIELGYDFSDRLGNPTWAVRVGVTLLLPK